MLFYYSLIIPKIENKIELGVVAFVSVLLHIMMIYFMVRTAGANPGIIPKMELDPSYILRIGRVRPDATRFLEPVNGVLLKHTFCST
jgi:hypothetical protein